MSLIGLIECTEDCLSFSFEVNWTRTGGSINVSV